MILQDIVDVVLDVILQDIVDVVLLLTCSIFFHLIIYGEVYIVVHTLTL